MKSLHNQCLPPIVFFFFSFSTDRELELRELRKMVLFSQAENHSLNDEMEELKVQFVVICIYIFCNLEFCNLLV